MARYRTVIPFTRPGTQSEPDVLRFTAKLGGVNGAEARGRSLELFRELRAASGQQSLQEIGENDVYFEENDPRAEVSLEMSALEIVPTVFCMQLTGPLDSTTALRLDREVYRLQHLGARKLCVDFNRVHPFSSAGLGVLLSLNDRLDLRLVKVPQQARMLLRTLGLDSTLQHFDSFPEALKAPRDKQAQESL